MNSKVYDTIIVGGGAAGLFCAGIVAQRGQKVLLVEHHKKLGQKILISGGGRCNFTNLKVSEKDYISDDLDFVKKIISSYPSSKFIELVMKHNISFYEKKMGQLFCKKKSQEIVDLLVKEIPGSKQVIQTNCEVEEVQKNKNGFTLKTSMGLKKCKNLVVATGGLPLKKIGASPWGYKRAIQFDHSIAPTRQALVPLVVTGFNDLSGVSVKDVIVRVGEHSVKDDFLFTHRGFSGPVILKASLYWQQGQEININFLPHKDLNEEFSILKEKFKSKKVLNVLKSFLPNSFVDFWGHKYLGKELDQKMNSISEKEWKKLCGFVHSFKVKPENYERMDRAEVTAGGVMTSELNPLSMESHKVSGLYFIGEVVNVTGLLGGYNFQWAWASAYVCGTNLKSLKVAP